MPESDPNPAVQQIEAHLLVVENDFRARFAAAITTEVLMTERARVLGKEGSFTEVLRLMGSVPAERKREFGERINAFRAQVETVYADRVKALSSC